MVEPVGSDGEEQALVREGTSQLSDQGGDRALSPHVTPGMNAALYVGAGVFAYGALVQLVAIAWVAIGAAIVTASGSILVRTGGLEPRTFGTCVTAAIVLDAVLLFGIVIASIARRVNQDPAAASESTYLRRPVLVTAVWLLIALLTVTAAGWKRSPYFPYPLATIVVLANAYFFALMSVLYTGRVVDWIWSPLKSWAQSSPYRTGLLTATLVLLGIAGVAARKTDWARESVGRLAAEAEQERPPAAAGFVDVQLAALCIAAEEVAPELARGGSAPGCRTLGGSDAGKQTGLLGSGPDCYATLQPDMEKAKGILKYKLRLAADDAEDIATDALLETCTRVPLPENLHAYFFKVVRNRGTRALVVARRTVPCDFVDELAPPTCSADPPEHRELELELVWQYARCVLDDREAHVVQTRLVDGLRFRDIGSLLGLREDQARYIFHNAIGKLQRRLANCLR
jgi:DNA-directed RNA polymerase specialized sigma24 family protein